jgi:hypothetical protein
MDLGRKADRGGARTAILFHENFIYIKINTMMTLTMTRARLSVYTLHVRSIAHTYGLYSIYARVSELL